MNPNSFLQEFDDEITTNTSIPYCQIQNPPNISMTQIEQYNPPWGWFIPGEQAELAQFKVPEYFEPIRLTFGEDTSQKREADGFLLRKIRFAILHRSTIEVQEKNQNGWRYIGRAYDKGNLTKFGFLANSDKENYRLRTRYLLVFLNEDNQLLHSIPLRLGMGRGVGGSFGEEIKQFRSEIERVFFKLRGEPQKALSDRAHALTVLEMELGLHKGEGKAPFICPVVRSAPAIDSVGTEKLVDRRDREVKLVGKAIETLLIPKSSATGQVILSLWEQYQDFPCSDRDDHEPEQEFSSAPPVETKPFPNATDEIEF